MSLYDSALDYFSINEIIKFRGNYYKVKKYTTTGIRSSKFEIYEVVQISYRSNDKSF